MSIQRNATYNLIGSVVPLAVSLITIPIYLGQIGEARYGVLAVAWLLLGYFGLFDLGLGRAVTQRIAALEKGSTEERASAFWTAFILNAGLGVVGGLLIWPIAEYFFGSVFKIDDALRSEMDSAIPWLVLAVPMATLSGVLTGALQGRGRFLELNLISVSGTVLFQILPLLAVLIWGPDLALILPAALLVRLLTLVILFESCRRLIFHNCAVRFASDQARQLLRFGGWVTVTALVGPIMVVFDRFIIGALLGANAVTYYTVPFQLSERSTIISNALTSAIFPRFASAGLEEEQRLAAEGLRALAVVVTPLMVMGIFLIEPFLTWWISPDFARQSLLVGQIILLGFWINSFAKIPYAQLQARGRPDLVAKCHLGEIVPFLGLLYFALNQFGLAGAATVFSIRVLADFFLLAGFAGILRQSMRILLIPAVLTGVAFLIALQNEGGQSRWLVAVAIHLLVTVTWALWQAPETLREALSFRLKTFRNFSQKPEIVGKK